MPQHPRVTPGPKRQLAAGTAGRTPPRVTPGAVTERRTPRRRDRKRGSRRAPAPTGAGNPLPLLGRATTPRPTVPRSQARSRVPPPARRADGGSGRRPPGRPKPQPGASRPTANADRSRLGQLNKSPGAPLAEGPAGAIPVQVTLEAPGWADTPKVDTLHRPDAQAVAWSRYPHRCQRPTAARTHRCHPRPAARGGPQPSPDQKRSQAEA